MDEKEEVPPVAKCLLCGAKHSLHEHEGQIELKGGLRVVFENMAEDLPIKLKDKEPKQIKVGEILEMYGGYDSYFPVFVTKEGIEIPDFHTTILWEDIDKARIELSPPLTGECQCKDKPDCGHYYSCTACYGMFNSHEELLRHNCVPLTVDSVYWDDCNKAHKKGENNCI